MNKLNELIAELCPNGVPYRTLKEICCSLPKGTLKTTDLKEDGKYPVINAGRTIYGYYDEYNNDCEAITFSSRGEYAGYITYFDSKFWAGGLCYPYTTKDENCALTKFLYYYLKSRENYIMEKMVEQGSIPALNKRDLEIIQLPLPPLEVQREIVRILDNFTELIAELTAELTARKKQYEYYTEHLMNFGDGVKMVTLGEIGSVKMCKRILKSQTNTTGGIPFYKIGTFGKEPDAFISEELFEEYKGKYSYPRKGDVLISCSGTIGRTVVFDGKPAYFQDSNIVWLEHDGTIVTNKYLQYCYKKQPWQISTGGTIARLYNDNVLKAKIPVPPVEEQVRIVSILDHFDALCNDISAEIEARQKQYEYYRDKLLNFTEKRGVE